jgi:hypothetical protein
LERSRDTCRICVLTFKFAACATGAAHLATRWSKVGDAIGQVPDVARPANDHDLLATATALVGCQVRRCCHGLLHASNSGVHDRADETVAETHIIVAGIKGLETTCTAASKGKQYVSSSMLAHYMPQVPLTTPQDQMSSAWCPAARPACRPRCLDPDPCFIMFRGTLLAGISLLWTH